METLGSYMNVSIFVIVIDRFIFYITLGVFHNASKSKLLTLIKKIDMFNCSTNCLCPIRFATNGSTSLLNENF